jgi:hypothetical protein
MKFTLTYEGELRSNADFKQKWEIRKHFDPQLRELWKIDPALCSVVENRHIPPNQEFIRVEKHHQSPLNTTRKSKVAGAKLTKERLDLCAPIVIKNRKFTPLVRDTFALKCVLKIKFLRKEEPGKLYQGGDLDNRIKTLLDALSIPNRDQIVEDTTIADPIYCLLEDDRLVTGLEIETHRLLKNPDASKHTVQLLIEVDVRVSQAKQYNIEFLGD